MPEKYTPRLSREKRRQYASELAVDLSKNDRPVFGTEKNEQERNESQEQFNAERAKLRETVLSNPNIEKILEEKPVFYKKEQGSTEYSLESDFQHLAHDEEFRKMMNNPLEYINRLLPIYRGERSQAALPKGKSIKELLSVPYDISRVKIMEAGGNKYVVKRVDEKKVQHDLEEYDLTKKAHEIGIPGPKPVGIIKSKGNTFLIFEYLENTTNLDEIMYRRKDDGSFSHENELVATLPTGVLPFPIINDRRWSKQAAKINIEYVFADKFGEQRGLWRDMKRFIDKLDRISDSNDSLEDIFLAFFIIFSRLREGLIKKENKLYKDIFGINFDNLPDVEYVVKDGRPLYKFKGLAESESQILLKNAINDCLIKIEKNWNKFIVFRDKVIKEKNNLYESAVPVYEKEHFGVSISVPYKKFIKMVEEKCAQNGIKHKDLEYRNVLTKINPETGAIEPDKDGNAQFYVVDWEQM